jgi:hypothetical protein
MAYLAVTRLIACVVYNRSASQCLPNAWFNLTMF